MNFKTQTDTISRCHKCQAPLTSDSFSLPGGRYGQDVCRPCLESIIATEKEAAEAAEAAAFDLFLGELIDAKVKVMRLRGQAEAAAKACKVLESRAPAGFWARHTSEVA